MSTLSTIIGIVTVTGGMYGFFYLIYTLSDLLFGTKAQGFTDKADFLKKEIEYTNKDVEDIHYRLAILERTFEEKLKVEEKRIKAFSGFMSDPHKTGIMTGNATIGDYSLTVGNVKPLGNSKFVVNPSSEEKVKKVAKKAVKKVK